ncbi:MAG: type III pantothenate kinase [Chloroherpetonaceae bacterium]|nr:type III pantothenate kinase [Chloroherpetonaceae bacterium]
MPDILSIDIGNSRLKLALLRGDEILFKTQEQTQRFKSAKFRREFCDSILQEVKAREARAEKIALSAVVPDVARLLTNRIERAFKKRVVSVSANLRLPFELRYKTPNTLGADRLALMAYAAKRFPNVAVIAIDFGTAITYDVLASERIYLGGLILSGFRASLSALRRQTAQLPEVALTSQTELIGESTVECLERGAYWGAIAQTESLIVRLKEHLKKTRGEKRVKIVATGGDAALVAERLKFDEIENDAVLKGAAYLAELN